MVAQVAQVPRKTMAEFCHRNHIRKLALFGSAVRDELSAESDVDVLVEFEADHSPDFFKLDDMSRELSAIYGGRRVDLMTFRGLSPFIRDQVLAQAQVQYER
jgi:uncharacterized protein